MIYFKFPFNENLYTIINSNETNSVAFFPFDNEQSIHFKGEIKETEMLNENEYHYSENALDNGLKEESQEEYYSNLQSIIETIRNNNLPKIVYSRRKFIAHNSNLNITKSFENLCKSYPNAFRYIFQQGETSWMGAFSEVLGKFNKTTQDFETMSLAGTLPVGEEWTFKEIEEQKPVTSFIKDILNKYANNIQVSDTYDHISGNIKHLRTDFKAQVKESELENLIKELHPTPAVCGIPKGFCKKIISEYEKFPRELYAGYIRIETDTEILFFVNLRCAKIYKNTIHLFVGGGITADSDIEKEWRETELKSQAVQRNLVIS